MLKNVSALEVMALNCLPEKARIARLAHICIKSNNGYSKADCKRAILQYGEPHGNKGRLTGLLQATMRAQRRITNSRKRSKIIWTGKIDERGGFDPIVERAHWDNSVSRRSKAICLSRIGKVRKDLLPNVYWWNGSITNHSVWSSLLRGGHYFLVLKQYHMSHHAEGKFVYLAYLCGGVAGYTRLPKRLLHHGVVSALKSLETAPVRTARKKGYEIQVDWENQTFLVKHPRRKKVRVIAWKKHSRAV